MAFFSIGSGQSAFLPQITPIDLSVLAFQPPLTAAQLQGQSSDPAVIPPWQLSQESESLDRRLNEVRRLTSFIDEQAPGVDSVGVGVDERASFVLFDALKKLETLAEVAADESTSPANLARLNEQFQAGLAEITDYIGSANTDKLTLLAGQRTSSTTSPIEIGTDQQTFTGQAVALGSRDDPIENLVGDEQFTVVIKRFDESFTIDINLADIEGPLSINAVVDHINTQITAVPATDSNGDPILRANGDPIPKFTTRFGIKTDDNFDHAIEVRTSLFEEVRLVPAVSEPSLFVTTNRTALRGDDPEQSRVTRFDDVAGAIVEATRTEIVGIDGRATRIAELTPTEDEDDVAGPVAAATTTAAVAVDSEGFIYTLGTSSGDFGNQQNLAADGEDVFLTKIDTLGNVVFSRLLGSATNAEAFSLAVDSQDNVIIAGSTTDNLGDNTRISGTDSFVTKFSARGDRIFTYQLDTVAQDKPAAIAIDADDNIILTGFSDGAINAATPSNGGRDVMLLKIDGDSGQRIDEALIGSATTERGEAVAIAEDGNILLASIDNGRAVLRKVDVNDFSNILFEQDLGQINNSGAISGLRVSGSNIFLAGSTSNSGFTGTAASIAKDFAGDTDGFVLKLTDNGSSADADFVSFVGTEAFDKINDIAVGASSVFVVGSTRGALEAGGREGPTDAFITRIDMATGAIEQVQQFGLLLTNNEATGIAFTNTGPSVLDALGLPAGTVDRIETRSVDSQTTAKAGDYFDISIDGGRKRRITLNEGDTFSDIARRINRLSFRGDVSADGSNGKLVIRANGSASVDLIAGEGSSDLLGKLGLKSQRLLGTDALFNLNDDDDRNSSSTESDLGGVFAFKLDGPLGLQDRQTAAFTLTQIQEAINTSQRAFRSLSPSILDTLGDQLGGSASGVVPTRLQSQLANYSAALSRLQSGSGGGGFFI